MLGFLFASLVGGIAPYYHPAFAQASQTVTVERVVDGDTIHTSPAVGEPDGVRFIGVDTPETVDPNDP